MRAQEFITEDENEYSPETHKLLVKARVAFPGAKSDQEALDLYALHQERTDVSRIDQVDRKSTRLNSSHVSESRMPSSA